MLDHVASLRFDLAVRRGFGLHALGRSIGDFEQFIGHGEVADLACARVLREKPGPLLVILERPASHGRFRGHVFRTANRPERLSLCELSANAIGNSLGVFGGASALVVAASLSLSVSH